MPGTPRVRSFVCVLALLALTMALAWVDVPVEHLRAARAADLVHGALALAVFFLICTGLGLGLSRALRLRYTGLADRIAFSFGLGAGGVTLLVFGLAAAQLFREWVLVLVFVALGVCVWRYAVDAAKAVFDAARRSISACHGSAFEAAVILLLVVSTAAVYAASTAPPFHHDCLNYHLAFPAMYLRHGGLRDVPNHFFASFPGNMSMLFALAMALKGGALAKQIHWLFGAVSALAVYALARQQSDRRTGLIAAGLFYACPLVLATSSFCLSDMAWTLYSVLSLDAMMRWIRGRGRPWLVASAAFFGLAFGTKYTAILFTLMPLGLLFALDVIRSGEWRGRGLLRAMGRGLGWGAVALAVMSPCLLKNFVFTGNPVYPYANALFGERLPFIGMGVEVVERLPHRQGMAAVAAHYLRSFKSLWTAEGSEMGWLGPCFTVYAVCLIWAPWRDRSVRVLAVLVAASIAAWVGTIQETRYFLIGLALLSVLLARGIRAAPRRARIATLCAVSLPILLACNVATTARMMVRRVGMLDVIVGNESAEAFLSDAVDYYPAVRYLNEHTPPGSKILFVGQSRGYYCRRDYVATHLTESNPFFRAIRSSSDAQDALAKLRAQGFTHLLVRPQGLLQAQAWSEWHRLYGLRDARDRAVFQALLSDRYTRLLFSDAAAKLREIPRPRP